LALPKKSNGNTYVFDYKQQSNKDAPATFAATQKSLADTLGALSRAGLHRLTEAARSNAASQLKYGCRRSSATWRKFLAGKWRDATAIDQLDGALLSEMSP
jgi:hypothetical protein